MKKCSSLGVLAVQHPCRLLHQCVDPERQGPCWYAFLRWVDEGHEDRADSIANYFKCFLSYLKSGDGQSWCKQAPSSKRRHAIAMTAPHNDAAKRARRGPQQH